MRAIYLSREEISNLQSYPFHLSVIVLRVMI